MIPWADMTLKEPPEPGHYLVWVPVWEGYGNVAHADVCWWSGQAWELGAFPSVEDGAPVSHWAVIGPPYQAETGFARRPSGRLKACPCGSRFWHRWTTTSGAMIAVCAECGQQSP